MGEPSRSGEFVENLDKELERQSTMSEWDWIEEANSTPAINIILKETVKALCRVNVNHETRICELESKVELLIAVTGKLV